MSFGLVGHSQMAEGPPSPGRRGNSIRTEDRWLSPMEFVQVSAVPNALWRRDIQGEGQPLSSLIEVTHFLFTFFCVCAQIPVSSIEVTEVTTSVCFVRSYKIKTLTCCHLVHNFHNTAIGPQTE